MINSLRVYEGPDSSLEKNERHYLYGFDCKETRYVWVELTWRKPMLKTVKCGLVNFTSIFKTRSGQLKGDIEKLFFVAAKEQQFECTIGWGSDLKGTWGNDSYSVDSNT
jgi:hypothetical protein